MLYLLLAQDPVASLNLCDRLKPSGSGRSPAVLVLGALALFRNGASGCVPTPAATEEPEAFAGSACRNSLEVKEPEARTLVAVDCLEAAAAVDGPRG